MPAKLNSPEASAVTRPASIDLPAGDAKFLALGAGVVAMATSAAQVALGLGDGRLHLLPLAEDGVHTTVQLCDGAVLAVVADSADSGFLAATDDGSVLHVDPDGGARKLCRAERNWVEQLTSHGTSRLRVLADGRRIRLFDRGGRQLAASADAPSALAGLCFNPRGRRIAAAHYGGVSLWWSGAVDKPPQRLEYRGSHVTISWSPDGAYIVTSLQERELHGWRLRDGADFRMSGYQTKIKSLSWSTNGRWLACSGAPALTCWDFGGAGPTGRRPREFAAPNGENVCLVAFHPRQNLVAAACKDGAVLIADPAIGMSRILCRGNGDGPTALAWMPDGRRLLLGTESGRLASLSISPLAA
jgi:WD40 repeat protein